jgi:hypothetical protein
MRTRSSLFGAAVATLALALPGAAAAADAPAVDVLSNRADLISAGDALVAVRLPAGADPAQVRVTAGERDVTDAFVVRDDGRFEGLVEGLAVGANTITATLGDGSTATATITNHPNGGPVFSGPQVKPWVCQPSATDAQCNQPPAYSYQYKSSRTGQLADYDPANPPSDVATTTTDQGVTVPFVIRHETGYQNRDQYRITVLYDPSRPWTAWAPQRQFNHKLLITHGASCGIDHQTGTAPSTTSDQGGGSSPLEALGRGFAVLSTALDNAGHNCNVVTQAESLVMAKERLVERYGELRYTIGTGCSGGSLTQQQVANAYPGIYQGILPQCSFPDAWSTGQQLVDYHQARGYVEDPRRWAPGVIWDPVSIAAVEGHPNHGNSIILDSLYWTALGDPTNPCAGVSDAERYDPQTNPHGVRCTLADYMVNVLGTRPQDGFAGRPLDNVGVQYGLTALRRGLITPAQFADLNAKIGGGDIDTRYQPERTVADRPALANAYRSGGVNETNNLDRVAIIDLRGSDDGAFHDAYRAFAIRARLEREHGSYANQVIWRGPVPLIGQADFTTRGLLAMDRWLSAVERDGRSVPLAQRIVDDRPADVHDECTNGLGQAVPDALCPAIVRTYATPRMVAGEGVETDIQKCALRPLRRTDYLPAEFTDAQWAQLRAAFPDGVCDYARPGVDQQPTIPWQTYQDASGDVITGGQPLGPAPAGSGGGLSAAAFAGG